MNRILVTIVVACLLGLGGTPAIAERAIAVRDMYFYVSPAGDNTKNDCLSETTPCRTAQYAYSLVMNNWDFAGHEPYIRLAAGFYPEGVIMTGQPVGSHVINVVGQQSWDIPQSCSLAQAEQVVVRAAPGTAAFDFEDGAIGIVRCMTIEGAGANAFTCRQTSASDIAYIKLGNTQELSGGILANDSCGVNIGGAIWFGNNVMELFASSNLSRITIADSLPFVAVNDVVISHFAIAQQLAIIEYRAGVSITGPITPGKASLVWRSGAIITNGLLIPGGIVQADPNAPGFIY